MAWLEKEPTGIYHVRFRFADAKFKKTLRTRNEREAEGRRLRLEENIRLVESGRLVIPEDTDVAMFRNRSPLSDEKP